MSHAGYWPKSWPRHLSVAETSLHANLEIAARRWPARPCLVFFDQVINYAECLERSERLAGFLQQRCGVKKGDRVLLNMQNSPQFVLAYYAILRADAVVVPVNPMNLTAELRHYVDDSGAKTAFVAQDLYARLRPLLADGSLDHVVVAAYSDELAQPAAPGVPEFVAAPRQDIADRGVTLWSQALAADCRPAPAAAGADDLAVMPYTSGTTGQPKGCMHTHRSVMHTAAAIGRWFGYNQDEVFLAAAPLFHVTGMQTSMNTPILCGGAIVLMPRWDRDLAARLIERHGVGAWATVPTMVIDLLAHPRIESFDLSSIRSLHGGGMAMPETVARRLLELCGITYVEGYGLSETMAPVTLNPPERAKRQCGGIPIFDTRLLVLDPTSMQPLPAGEVGEIVVCGPQVFQGYWNNPRATAEAFVEFEGLRYLRTGDLGRSDEDGYVQIVDRLKRMINASGYKVWPAEVEGLLYQHPCILEACVIAALDERRGETVKAVVALKEEQRGRISEQDIIDWSRQNMAAYKVPRVVEFVAALPRSGTGKVQWRALQESERGR